LKTLRFPAIEFRQGPKRRLYSFAVDGKVLPVFTTVSRVRRAEGEVEGYQRPEVMSHIKAIRKYIESEDPLLPNALVVAFDGRARFEPAEGGASNDYSRVGEFVVEFDNTVPDEHKPGWIVDGQQRSAAIREAFVDSFPVSVVAFITDSEAEQRAQFILVNSTKPLPKGLIYELLPLTDEPLPDLLERRRLPARISERLNQDPYSPLHGRIRTPTTPQGIIKDNSILRMLENSLSDGALYRFHEPRTGEADIDSILAVLKNFWGAVRNVFPRAWDEPPKKSRLVHGVGIASMGFLMDAIADHYLDDGLPTLEQFVENLTPLVPICRWTDGYWDFGPNATRRWNELQNTTKDIQLLANYLLGQYRRLITNVT
jgi:DGQHR domain-containing protein